MNDIELHWYVLVGLVGLIGQMCELCDVWVQRVHNKALGIMLLSIARYCCVKDKIGEDQRRLLCKWKRLASWKKYEQTLILCSCEAKFIWNFSDHSTLIFCCCADRAYHITYRSIIIIYHQSFSINLYFKAQFLLEFRRIYIHGPKKKWTKCSLIFRNSISLIS